MASDVTADGDATALVRAVREKIVAYKASLLRQLLEQRDALIAAADDDDRVDSASSSSKREKREKDEEVEEKETSGDERRSSARAAAAGDSSTSSSRRRRRSDGRTAAAAGDTALSTAAVPTDAHRQSDALGDAHRRSETSTDGADDRDAESATDPTVAAVAPSFGPRRSADASRLNAAHAKSSSVSDDNVERKKRSREPSAADATAVLETRPAAKRVVRTSTPSAKYLQDAQRRREREFSSASVAQPVLLAAASTTASATAPVELPVRPRELSLEELQRDFETQLRASVRVSSDVRARSVSVTRKRQLPRLSTPAQPKSHWDYVLAEMQWMATDFAQERNWKRAMQFHLAKDVVAAQNAERVRLERANRQLARDVAQQVSAFWRSMERIAARSRVRFEATGTSSNDDSDALAAYALDASDDATLSSASTSVVLQYKTIEVESGAVDATLVASAKEKMQRIVRAGRAARDAMAFSPESEDASTAAREDALRTVRARAAESRMILAAFQVLALRWMLELYSAGLNMLLNDQLGMGKAATISAFLSLLSVLDSPAASPQDRSACAAGPHLIVVAEDELPKWQFHLRVWRHHWRVQLYSGSQVTREQLQREWRQHKAAAADAQFLDASDDDELWADDALPLFCVLCPVGVFVDDAAAFAQFTDWQMLVVENEGDARFDDLETIAALQRVRQQQRRILSNGRPVESWASAAVRSQYAAFLLELDSADATADIWTRTLLLDKAAAAHAMQACGKPSSVVASLWKAAQLESASHVSAVLVALYCLGLRRVRSEVETQLGKIEEQSVSCQLSESQRTQYRNAISGFTTSIATMHAREERLDEWLQLVLRLRAICNCVDIVNDLDKLALADVRMIAQCSGKLDALAALLLRLVRKDAKRVLLYCQLSALFPVLEMLLTLLDVSFVRIAGDVRSQQRALAHFAERTAVHVALASTRLACAHGTRAAAVYGADAIVVLDSDWSALCDAKLRASWAKMAVGRDVVPVYRVHCEQTVEASLLRVGACFSEKVFGEMTPHELLAVPSDVLVGAALEKPSWWTSNAVPGSAAATVLASLARAAHDAETHEKYSGDASELAEPLVVQDVDLDAEEHLLLSNTDELTPVEWYAVDYVHGLADRKRSSSSGNRDSPHDDEHASDGWTDAQVASSTQSFDDAVAREQAQLWQDGDAAQQLFYPVADASVAFAPVDDATVAQVFAALRARGVEAQYDIYGPPQPPLSSSAATTPLSSGSTSLVFREPGAVDSHEMLVHVSYRVPAPPAPVKIKSELASHAALTDASGKPVKATKKQRNAAASGASGGAAGRSGGAASSTASASVAGMKRKLEQQSGAYAGAKSASTKEQRVDLEGIPLADVAEFEDDDFWGDTNLDALDSASWDDASVLSGILGPATVDTSAAGGAGAGTASGRSGAAGASQDGASTSAPRTSSKKTKGGVGGTSRARKGSVSSSSSTTADAGRDGWSAQDDQVLKKLFELYGSNWTLIAHVFNATTAVSRFFCKKRTPRQCYDRYGKIISGSLSSGGSGSAAKDSSKATSAKHAKATSSSSASVTVLSPAMLDARIGVPADEVLLVFATRHALPGLPPPSIVNVPSLVEMSLRKKKQQQQQSASSSSSSMDDLKSIRSSFDAIIQCMKRKTAPPPIPIPTGAAAAATGAATDFGLKASLTATGAASFSPSPASKAAAKASGSSTKTLAAVPPPHKSHMDILSLLPAGPVAPDDVIKRSKEVAAVQAAAAVASVGRDVSPLSAAGDAILGAAFGSTASMARKHYGGGNGMSAVMSARVGVNSVAHGAIPGSKLSTPSAASTAPSTGAASSPAWGDMSSLHHMARTGGSLTAMDLTSASGVGSSGLSTAASGSNVPGASVGTPSSGATTKPPMPVTTSTLLHVLDRMPEIKNKIQTILNRSDCSEAQKVTMIARLLSNTNAISSSGVLPPSSASPIASHHHPQQSPHLHASSPGSVGPSGVLTTLEASHTASSSSSGNLIDLETPIPMPAALAAASTPTTATTGVHMSGNNAALLLESLAPSPVSTPRAFPPNPSQQQP